MSEQNEKRVLRGCTDGNCRLRFPRGLSIGMHTNGGCRCLTDLPTAKRIEAEKALKYRDDEIDRLMARKVELVKALELAEQHLTLLYGKSNDDDFLMRTVRAALKEST